MKKRVIALSVAAALGGLAVTASAQAQTAWFLVFNPDGVGHINLVPYFSTQGGNATLLNITNTDTVNGKAVKVRFRGASNSDDIFDFQLFLSPGDMWTANISQAASGRSKLSTSDNSCTLPAKSVINGTDFITARLNTVDLTGDALANETREGYIEILNMADIPSSTSTSSIYAVTKHNTAGTPSCTASVLESLSQGDTRLALPTTGLMANWTIINIPQTTTWTGDAAAIEARFSTGVNGEFSAGTGFNVYWPQTATALTPTQISDNTADALFRAGLAGSNFDLPDLSTPYVLGTVADPQDQAWLLSSSMSATKVAAEYLSDPTISASTDWVISMPTRRYFIAVDYTATAPEDKLVTNYDDNDPGNFDAEYFRSALSDAYTGGVSEPGNTVMGTAANGGKSYQACIQISSAQFWNREELSPASSGIVISPGSPAPAPSLCGEVSVLGINSATNSPLKATVSRFNLALPGGLVDGWGMLTALNTTHGNTIGLPMLMSQFSKATNPAVSPGVSGTFGARWGGRVIQRGYHFIH